MVALVFDTSALINFGRRANLAQLLAKFSASYKLVIPIEVSREVVDPKTRQVVDRFFEIEKESFSSFEIREVHDASADLTSADLAVIALAKKLNCRAVTDDKAERCVAARLGVSVVGTIGLLNESIAKQWLTDAEAIEHVRRLRKNKFICPTIADDDTFTSYFRRLTSG